MTGGLSGRRLLVLTEGGRERGLGHITRCSAYAEGWATAGGSVGWIIDGDDLARAAVDQGADMTLAAWQEAPVDVTGADVVLVDSYVLDAAGRPRLAREARLPVFLDDLGQDAPRGLVINGGLSARAPAGARAEWLCGPDWQALRAPFQTLTPRAPSAEVERVLVMMGGTDPRGLTGRMARVAAGVFPGARIEVVGAAGDLPDRATRHEALDASAMAALMQACDLAISAAGQTLFELARCGVPTVMVQAADNQAANLGAWPQATGFVAAGTWDASDLDARVEDGLRQLAALSTRLAVWEGATGIVDGQGVARLIALLTDRLGEA